MEKRLLLKNKYGDEIAKLFSFTYNAKRMGGAPTISASLSSFKKLELTTDDYVEFNGEKYYIKHTPTSSKTNTDARYKYDLEFVSERIMLDDIYFYDTTHSTDSASTSIAKSADFPFSGTVHDLADKINSSLQSSKVYGYTVIVGDDVLSSEDKLITFSNVFISNAIQEFYNTFEVPYYFYWDKEKGKTIIFVTHGSGKSPAVPFTYGKENALLSITKTNANYKIINKCTGVGSSENLPYYYPNISSTGEHTLNADKDFGETRINYDVLSKHTNLRDGATLTYHKKPSDSTYSYNISYRKWERVNSSVEHTEEVFITNSTTFKDTCHCDYNSNDGYFIIREIKLYFSASKGEAFKTVFQCGLQTIESSDGIIDSDSIRTYYRIFTDDYDNTTIVTKTEITDGTIQFTPEETNNYYISIEVAFKLEGSKGSEDIPVNVSATFTPYRKVRKEDYFTFDDNNKEIDVSLSGVTVKNPKEGGQIVVSETLNWIEPQQVLMPSIYRGTNGIERYYIASNESVTSGGYTYDFDGHEFKNPYEEGRPKEHIITVDDLKPTIAGMSSNGENVDTFRDFAYDVNDNDEIDDGNHYKHPYFYAKLKKLDFNLFDQASKSGEMIISFTSGKCASCKFAVVVDENTRKNLVQVDANGNLVFDENGVVKQISSYQAEQQDTINNEVWIALRKEDSTMGVVMPNVTNKEKPTTEDTFVITNINLPISYILKAEKLLEDKIKEYLINNNDDKFNFSIKFSRIYLAENEDVRNNISENSSITVIYQGKESGLYVSSYTYKMVEGEALPEITVELSDTLAQNNGIMRNVVSRVKMEVMTSVSNVDIIAQGARAFIRKDQNDQTVYRITANELNVNTDSNVGGDLDVGSNAHVGGELTVKRKASFDENVEVGADVTVGDYQEILGEIQGAKISQQGDAVFKSLRANYLEIFTLIYNQIRATSAYTAFDDTATIIDVKVDDDGVYTLTFEGDDEYIQPFTEYDIVHGFVNSLNNYGYSISGECWMNIVEVQPNGNKNQVKAILFSEEDTPSKNIVPTKNMVICHRGNNAPKGLDDAEYDKRRNTFFISSADGNIVQLMDVTSPKLLDIKDGYSNYGVVMGKLPPDLFEYIKSSYSFVSENDPILYAKYVAVQNLLQIDYLGRLIKTERYRGEWNQNVAEGTVEGEEVYRSLNSTDVTYYDTVSYEGSKWQCFTDKTTEEPSKNNTAWTIIVEKGEEGKSATITANDVFYTTSTNGASHPDLENGGWSKVFPQVNDGDFLWTWTHVEYSDGNKSNVFSVSRKGIDGKGIQNSVVTYTIKDKPSSPENFAESDWGDFPTTLTDGYWLYTRTVVIFSDGKTSTSYDVAQVGQGSYYAGLQEYYAAGSSNTTIPTGYPQNKEYVNGVATYVSGEDVSIEKPWSYTRPILDSSTPYLWNFSISRDSKGNQYVVYPVCIGNFAKGIKLVEEKYAISKDGKVPNDTTQKYPTDITSWANEANAVPPTNDKPYQWNYTKTTYNDGSFDEVYHVVSVKGDKGDSVTGSTIQYAINQSMTEKPDKNEFDEDYPTTINEGDVLWTRTKVNFDNDSIASEWAYSASRQAANGKGINSITTQYSITPNSIQPDITNESLWHDTIEEAGKLVPNSYLWTATITDYGDTSKKDEWSITVQRISADGTSAKAGQAEYQVHSDGVNPPTGDWSTEVPSVGENQYLWTRIPFIDGNETTYAYSVSKSGQSVTIDEIKYATSTTTKQPSDEKFTYDTPPSVGEGEYLWTRTTFGGASKKVIYTYAYQGMDNSAVEFSLQPNVTTIYFDDDGDLSTKSIYIKVRKTTSKGVVFIDDDKVLDKEGFKLQYTYDGILDDRKDLILNPETLLLEDDSELLLEDDSPVELEFTVEDVVKLKESIEFYLVKEDTDEIWATCTVAVVPKESTLSVELSIKDITVNVNAEEEPWIVLDPTTEYQVDVQVKKGGIAQDLSKYTLSNRSSNTSVSSSEDAFDFTPIDNYTKAVVLTVTNGMSFDELPKWVEFTAVNNRNTDKKASDKLYIKSAQRGEDLSSLVVAPKTIFVNVGVSGGNTGKIIDPTKEHTIEFQIKKGDKPQQLSNYSIVVKHQTSSTLDKAVLVYDKDEYTKYFTIECKNGESVPPTHTITAKKGSLTLNEDVTIHPVQQGLVGSSGKLYYSMGYWDETTAAEKFYVNDDKRICYIYHVDSFYERTDKDLMTYTDEDGKTRYYPPNKEVELFGSNGGWAVMPKYSAIIADFIMAKFARFGSPNGGVFYSNLLFSAMGVDENGDQVPYDMYSDDMFVGDDENGYEFSGVFTPNVFIDFLKGVLESRNAKIYGSIATPPKSLPSPNEEGKIVLDFETGFNFSGDPVNESRSIVLPTNAIYDGVQASIVNYGTGKGYYSVATDLGEDDDFLFDGRGPVGKIIREVHLYGVSEMKLRAIKVKVAGIGWRCKWFLENSQNFGFESRWGNLGVFSNQIPSSPIETVAIYTVVNETIRDSLSLIPSYMSRYGFVKNEDTLYYYLTIDDIQLDSTRTLIKVNHETSYTAHASISNNVITIYFKEEDNTRSNFGEWSIEILRLI